jgi:hypothetical protein
MSWKRDWGVMPNELSSATEADFGRVLEDVGGLKQQIKKP